jgi:nucleolar protein 58
LKGKVSRMLAAKTALCIRQDALGETEGVTIGLEGREKVEMRLRQMEGGSTQKATPTPKKPDQDKYRKPVNITQYNAEADVSMDTNGEEERKVKTEDGSSNGEKEKKKKDKKRKVEEIVETPVVEEEEEDEPEKKKKKKKSKDKKSEE